MNCNLSIIIKGAGEMASGIAWRLYQAGFKNIVMLDIANPMAVRRAVCFCEAIYDGTKVVDGVTGVLATSQAEIDQALENKDIPVLIDPSWETIGERCPQVVIDAILAKRNLGTRIDEAEHVIGLGPGFSAGNDVHAVIETHRGPNCGRVIHKGCASANTGIPGSVMGYDVERVVRAPASGQFISSVSLNDTVKKGDIIGSVEQKNVRALLDGSVRGLIRNKIFVEKNVKIGDIEPRPDVDNNLVSDKSLGLGGAVLESVLSKFNV